MPNARLCLASALAVALAGVALPATATAATPRAAGDFNGDGKADVAIGVPGEKTAGDPGGAVQVLYAPNGAYGARQQLLHQNTKGVPGRGERGDAFGSSLAVADVDGDGYDDLAIGVPGENVGRFADAGAAVVLWGSPNGLTGRKCCLLDPRAELTATGDSPRRAAMGTSLTFADLDGTGGSELAAGAPGAQVAGRAGAGAVAVFANVGGALTGTPGGRAPHALTQHEPAVPGAAEAGDAFGTALTAADFTGDGKDDLAVGVPGEAIGRRKRAGLVNLFTGAAASATRLPLAYAGRTYTQTTRGAHGRSETGDAFGTALSAGTLGYDGSPRLAVGVPGEDIRTHRDAGAVMLFDPRNTARPGLRELDQGSPGVAGAPERGDAFGAAVLAGGFGPGGGLAVGAPGENVGHIADAGAVSILPGTPTGPGTAGDVAWSESTPGVPGQAERDDAFGATLAGRNPSDLLIGAPGEKIGRAAGAGALTELFGLHPRTAGGPIVMTGRAASVFQGSTVSGVAERNDRFATALASAH